MKARTLIYLVAAFSAVVLAFVGSTVVAQGAARQVRDLSVRISRDAAPGIEAMAELRSEVRRIEALVRREDERPVEDLESEIADARDKLIRAQVRFHDLPTMSDAERAIFPRLLASVRAFDESVERALERERAGKPPQLHDLLPYGEVAAKTAQELLDVDAREAREMADRIETTHERANRLALELDALSAVLAAIAAWLAVRAVRQVLHLQEENRQLMERKADELEQFAGRVAHDVLSPLTSVSMALSLAQKTTGAASQNAASRGIASLMRVRSVVNSLLDFARAGALPDPAVHASVPQVMVGLGEELRPQAAADNIELAIDAPEHVAVSCSPGVLTILLTNLVRNSIKYMGESVERVVHVSARARRSLVVFEVEDSGPGVPEYLGERIFEPYVRGKETAAKRSGIGLGLATVKRLVLAHGGSVGVRRSSLGGALFWFELPRAEGASDPESVRSPEEPAQPA